MIMTALLAVAVALVLGDLNHRQREFRREARMVALNHLGDAAMAETLAELAVDPSSSGVALHALAGGVIWSSVAPTGEGQLRVVAEARYDQWRGVLEATVQLEDGRPRVVQWTRRTAPAG